MAVSLYNVQWVENATRDLRARVLAIYPMRRWLHPVCCRPCCLAMSFLMRPAHCGADTRQTSWLSSVGAVRSMSETTAAPLAAALAFGANFVGSVRWSWRTSGRGWRIPRSFRALSHFCGGSALVKIIKDICSLLSCVNVLNADTAA